MHLAFINLHGNFDSKDSRISTHPDFGGQHIYVKQVAIALGSLGHTVDIITRQIIDEEWPEFGGQIDYYHGHDNVRIVRIPCGPPKFLYKEELWPFLGNEFTTRLVRYYKDAAPDFITAHYADSGIVATIAARQLGRPFVFTAHSLGAQKLQTVGVDRSNIRDMDKRYRFSHRIIAERISMNHSLINVVSTFQEQHEQYNHVLYKEAIDPFDNNRFSIIPPGCSMDIFNRNRRSPHEDKIYVDTYTVLKRYIQPDRINLPLIITSSRIDVKKNHLGLIRAFAANNYLREISNLIIFADIEDINDSFDHLPHNSRIILNEIRGIIHSANLLGFV